MKLINMALINNYIESKKLAWSPSTIRSEKARLLAVVDVLDGNPERLWGYLEKRGVAPYTRVTVWTRVTCFWAEAFVEEKNRYEEFRKTNARLFKNAYVKRPAPIDYATCKAACKKISKPEIREKALIILESAIRAGELRSMVNGEVVGKGGKTRRVYNDLSKNGKGDAGVVTYTQLYRELQKVGLKPHDLRKAALSRLVELGANPFELCEAAGWSSLQTAQSYISVNSKRLEELFSKLGEKK